MADITPLIERLRGADPDRLRMALLAAKPARARLVTLYVLNDELARTALAARDPLVAEIRVQWWIDRLQAFADGPPPPHELLTPLWDAWGNEGAALGSLAMARRHDAAREPFDRPEDVADYAEATGGALMALAAGAAGTLASEVARTQGRGAGIVAWLRARPALQPLGLGLATPSPEIIRILGSLAAEAFALAAADRQQIDRAAAPLLFPGAGIPAALKAASAGQDPLPASEFARRAAFARLALTGRWWV